MRLGASVVATMSALVLGFLVSSASNSLERTADGLLQIAGKVILLDRALANYGPETGDIRNTIKEIYTSELAQLFSGDEAAQERLTTLEAIAKTESIPARLRELTPASDAARLYQAEALTLAAEVSADRWLLLFQRWSTIPVALLVALVLWLAAIFCLLRPVRAAERDGCRRPLRLRPVGVECRLPDRGDEQPVQRLDHAFGRTRCNRRWSTSASRATRR